MTEHWPAASALVVVILSGCALSHHETRENGSMPEAQPAPDARQTFVYFIHPTREGFIDSPTEEESARVQEHFLYLKDLTERGVVLLAGPSTSPPYTGIVLFKAADPDQAKAIMTNDPAVRAGLFEARLAPFRMSLIGDLR
ncbi:MAG: hypothetical protein GY842_07420 [bacterium]|nr:hypothetical protein [bacterium]